MEPCTCSCRNFTTAKAVIEPVVTAFPLCSSLRMIVDCGYGRAWVVRRPTLVVCSVSVDLFQYWILMAVTERGAGGTRRIHRWPASKNPLQGAVIVLERG